ncbi:MAG: carbon-nitrogen hydrolase family protein [Candidatus Binatia bacterium]
MSTASPSRGPPLRIAGVQVESRNGEVEANLARAGAWVAQAAERGAHLVLCPEFLAAGYIYDPSIWESAEPQDGPTERWLRARAVAHRVYVGATYLEVDGEDFYNAFALAAPDGSVAGRVRKEALPGFEGWYFRSDPGSKVIDTDLGRIAVGICHDNHTARFMRRLCHEDVDLLLMPHSAPLSGLLPRAIMCDALQSIAPYYARVFGIPTVMVNKWSATDSPSPIPIAPFVTLRFRFPGLSTICDSDGAVLDHRADGEGIVLADVRLDPELRRSPAQPTGYWSRPPKHFARTGSALFRLFERLGTAAYARSDARKAAARAAATRASR